MQATAKLFVNIIELGHQDDFVIKNLSTIFYWIKKKNNDENNGVIEFKNLIETELEERSASTNAHTFLDKMFEKYKEMSIDESTTESYFRFNPRLKSSDEKLSILEVSLLTCAFKEIGLISDEKYYDIVTSSVERSETDDFPSLLNLINKIELELNSLTSTTILSPSDINSWRNRTSLGLLYKIQSNSKNLLKLTIATSGGKIDEKWDTLISF